MPEVDYAVLSEWFEWIISNISIPVDLIGESVCKCLKLSLIINDLHLSECDDDDDDE